MASLFPLLSLLATCIFVAAARSSNRIVGGFEVDIADVPYQVSFDEGDGHYCGGSIISSRWVLTAAHCVGPVSENSFLNVRVGSSYHAEGGHLIGTKRIVPHSKFDHVNVNYDYDFALVELAEELVFTQDFFPVELPEEDELVEDGTCLQVSGWGNTQNNLESDEVLRATNVPAVNQEKCRRAYVGIKEVTSRMLCAGYEHGGKDACQGDSGGPLVEGKKVVGVVSWGKGCALDGYPGVYSRVAAVREWIKEISGV